MDPRAVAQDGTRGGQRVGDRGQPGGEGPEALFRGRERSGDQRVQQRTRVVLQRIPLVLADLGVLEQRALHLCQEYPVVDPVLGSQLVSVHLGQCGRGVAQHGHVPRYGVPGQVG